MEWAALEGPCGWTCLPREGYEAEMEQSTTWHLNAIVEFSKSFLFAKKHLFLDVHSFYNLKIMDF